MTGDSRFLVCPGCEHSERLEDRDGEHDGDDCPECGSSRAYRHHERALPDAESEAYVKLDADEAEKR